MSVASICTRRVTTVPLAESVRDCARRMSAECTSTIVVLDRDGRPRGVISDRDLVTRCMARGADLDQTTAEAIMTQPVRTIKEGASIHAAVDTMDRVGLRRLVVTRDDGSVGGLLSLDDVLLQLASHTARIGGILASGVPSILDH